MAIFCTILLIKFRVEFTDRPENSGNLIPQTPFAILVQMAKKDDLWYIQDPFVQHPASLVANFSRPDFVILQRDDVNH